MLQPKFKEGEIVYNFHVEMWIEVIRTQKEPFSPLRFVIGKYRTKNSELDRQVVTCFESSCVPQAEGLILCLKTQ